MSLPSELSPALSDGVVLCYLANHVRPRSVASIHVPSPAVVNFVNIYSQHISRIMNVVNLLHLFYCTA